MKLSELKAINIPQLARLLNLCEFDKISATQLHRLLENIEADNPRPAPNWDNAPDWANYWTVDADGEAIWRKNKPEIHEDIDVWVSMGREKSDTAIVPDWRERIEERPPAAQLGLKLCPYCQSKPFGRCVGGWCWIECIACGARGPGNISSEAAREAWGYDDAH